jgi:hypothetical protein
MDFHVYINAVLLSVDSIYTSDVSEMGMVDGAGSTSENIANGFRNGQKHFLTIFLSISPLWPLDP